MSCFTYLFFYLPSLLLAARACMNMDVGGPLEKGWHPGNHLWGKKTGYFLSLQPPTVDVPSGRANNLYSMLGW